MKVHNYNTQWEDKLERQLFSLGERTFAPDSKLLTINKEEPLISQNFIAGFSVITKAMATCVLTFKLCRDFCSDDFAET